MKPPWHVKTYDARVVICNAEGWNFEIILSQKAQHVPTLADHLAIAGRIVEAVNAHERV